MSSIQWAIEVEIKLNSFSTDCYLKPISRIVYFELFKGK